MRKAYIEAAKQKRNNNIKLAKNHLITKKKKEKELQMIQQLMDLLASSKNNL